MVNYATYNYGLLAKFVEGNVQNRIKTLYEHINVFITSNGPILEDIKQRTNIIDNIPFGKIRKAVMENSLRNDLDGAKKSLSTYNRIFGRVDLWTDPHLPDSKLRYSSFI